MGELGGFSSFQKRRRIRAIYASDFVETNTRMPLIRALEKMEWTKEKYLVSTDKERLDLEVIYGYLKTSYWASHRSKDLVAKSIETSLCFGLFEKDQQIGFGRVITDAACTSYVCDVFILPEYQGRGLGGWLIESIVSHPELKRTNFLLATRDAHELYEKFGFKRTELMAKPRPH